MGSEKISPPPHKELSLGLDFWRYAIFSCMREPYVELAPSGALPYRASPLITRELPGQMNHGLSFIMPMVVSGYAVFQANSCSLNVQ
ncbi:hypothetical protein TNCV_4147581 [Trichonephila clavipes]|nr:hypothetical protein TNCV_4147581 [Trichonephila clavipes]